MATRKISTFFRTIIKSRDESKTSSSSECSDSDFLPPPDIHLPVSVQKGTYSSDSSHSWPYNRDGDGDGDHVSQPTPREGIPRLAHKKRAQTTRRKVKTKGGGGDSFRNGCFHSRGCATARRKMRCFVRYAGNTGEKTVCLDKRNSKL